MEEEEGREHQAAEVNRSYLSGNFSTRCNAWGEKVGFPTGFFLGWRENVDACKRCIHMSEILNEILIRTRDVNL